MTRWYKIVIYFLLIGIVVYLVASFSEVSKAIAFLQEQKDEMKDDTLNLISSTVIANNHDGTQAYVLNDPLYEESFTSSDVTFTFSIYPLVEFRNSSASNAIAFVITHFSMDSDNAALSDNDFHLLNLSFVFDREIQINGGPASSTIERFAETFDDSTRIIMIQRQRLETDIGVAEFEYLSISYTGIGGNETTLLRLTNSTFHELSSTDQFDVSYNRDIANVSADNWDLYRTYGLNDYQNSSEIYYNESLLETYQSFNWYLYRDMAIALAVIIPVTYFMFFHKYVMIKYRHRKIKKREAYEQVKEQIKKEMNTRDDA